MLAFITTDAPVHPDWWQSTLSAAVDQTFNSASIDGCTSTNDTVIALASGSAGGPVVGADTPDG
ncbi:MAG: bifunctional ornithine acetyltransferase/N-acetylglutamate synthase [Acidimicrobiia bacterium]|nr:bifunctional ornithine acetyltransferase/N-acetylglutamate synthase [Acidimicrobiia bacterium]